MVAADPFFISRRLQLATLATRHLIPAVYNAREYAEAGGLMTYGTSLTEVFRHISAYTIRILKGTNPADLPVVQSTNARRKRRGCNYTKLSLFERLETAERRASAGKGLPCRRAA